MTLSISFPGRCYFQWELFGSLSFYFYDLHQGNPSTVDALQRVLLCCTKHAQYPLTGKYNKQCFEIYKETIIA